MFPLHPNHTKRPHSVTAIFDTAIDRAIERSGRDGRNNAGLGMACQFRDNGYTQAQTETAAKIYAAAVGLGAREAISTVRSAYRRPAREPWGSGRQYRPRPPVVPNIRAHDDGQRRREDQALGIWAKTQALPGTLGEAYLEDRGLSADNLEHAVRFGASVPFGGERHDCIVVLFRDSETDEPCGIHRTALTPDGKKIDRKMLGRAGGAAVKLTPDDAVTLGLGIAEGVETALSVMQSGWAPVWAALSAGSIERFPVLEGVEHLTIWADHDEAGLHAARACAERWAAANRGATIRYPKQAGNDFNDGGH